MHLILLYLIQVGAYYQCSRNLNGITEIEVNPFNFNNEFKPTTNIEVEGEAAGANQFKTIYTLEAFQLVKLYFDLRHLYKYADENNKDIHFDYANSDWSIAIMIQNKTIQLPYTFTKESIQQDASFSFTLFVIKQSAMEVWIRINQTQFYSQQFQFMNTTKITSIVPNRAILGQPYIFIFIVESTDQLALPANILPLDEQQQYLDYIISYADTTALTSNLYKQYSPASSYWGSKALVLLPYIPYFSNCLGYGQYMILYELTQHPNCTLVSKEETEPINPFQFGMVPTSDICQGIKLQCVIDEKYNSNPRLPRWFEIATGATIFLMKADALSPDEFNADFDLETSQQVDILATNSVPVGMMPLEVELTIQYYQVNQIDKRIIAGSITFSNFYKLQDNQKAGTEDIKYNLIFNMIPMNQPELVNAFALEWPVYFLLYLIIGSLLVLELVFFLLYHYIFNRKTPRPKIKLFVYIKALWPSSLYGVTLAIVPIMLIYILIAIIMAGKMWTTDLSYACSLSSASDSDSGCAKVFFDLFKNELNYNDDAFNNIRNGRCGIAMIVCGSYLLYVMSAILVPKKDKKSDTSYNGNFQNDRLWKRYRILYASMLMTTLMVILIQFSFTNIFGNNAYVFLIFNKIAQMVIEYILEKYFDNNLLLCPFAINVSILVGVATMGNPTFYDFLLSTFIDKGVEMFERAYVIKVQDLVQSDLEQKYNKALKMLRKLLDEDEEEQELDGELFTERKIVKESQEDDDSDSDIIFSDDYHENLASDDESVHSNKHPSSHSPDQLSFGEADRDEFEVKFRGMLMDHENKQLDFQVEKNNTVEEIYEDVQDQTDLIDYFSNFANDIVTLLYNPFGTIILWLFYEESNILPSYSIKQSEFIYYFLWTIISVPFQIIIDVLGYNLVEQYHELDFLAYIHNAKQRFDNRKVFWKADEEENAISTEQCFKVLDQWCYSSQFYFISTLFVCGLQFLVIGSNTIYMNQYDMFADQALLFIGAFWILVSYIFHKAVIFIGIKLKIWQIDTSRVYPEDNQLLMTSIEELDIKSQTSQPATISFLQIPNWDKAIKYREQQERLSEINNNLNQDQYQSEQFRRMFLNSNKQWMVDNIRLILSPRTLKRYRKPILDKFTQIYGPLEKKNEEDPVAGFDNTWNYRQFTKATTMNEANRQQQKFNRKVDQIPPNLLAILKYWLHRARYQKTTIQYIGGLLEKITKPYCEFCGLNWGLRVDTEQRIEDIYLKFLKLRKLKYVSKGNEIDDWQNYFSKQCKFRTTCFICSVFMVEDLLKDKMRKYTDSKHQQQAKKQRYTFKKIARLILIWVKFYRYVTVTSEMSEDQLLL